MAQRSGRRCLAGPRRLVGPLLSRHWGPDVKLGMRLAGAAVGTVVAAVPAALALVLVEARWAPLRRLDRGAAASLHQQALEHPGLVRALRFLTDVVWGPVTMRLLVAVLVVWLLRRRAWRLAAWAAVTALAGAAAGLLAKNTVERARPLLPDPVAHSPGFSFPSGHAMTATTSCAILLLVLLPLVPRRRRPVPWALAVVTVLGVSGTRVALGVHWVSDVIGGWFLGLAVVTATALAFEAWRSDIGRPLTTPAQHLEPEIADADRPASHGGRSRSL
nr:putative phosphoesterase [uncultured bacterium]